VTPNARVEGSENGTGAASPTRILVVAETRLYREGLEQILARHPRVEVAASAADAPGALEAIAACDPDAVLVDVGATGSTGALRQIVGAVPESRVVAFGVAESEELILNCAEAGVAGYVPRDASLDELIAVVEGVMRNELVCSPRLAGTLLRRVGALARERSGDNSEVRLTSRETQIVGLIDEGLSNKEIATRLQIELATVKNHVHHLLEKLDVGRRAEAAARVRHLRRQGWNRLPGNVGSTPPP
jgi:two-component system, NarL family, nitrate/nitrite response regulator NarL